MTLGKRAPIRRFLRAFALPVEWVIRKVKKLLRKGSPQPSSSQASVQYVLDPSIAVNLAKTDELLLAFMRSSQRQNTAPIQVQTPVSPCQIMPGRILTAHPHADFFICPMDEVRPLGMLLAQGFDKGLSKSMLEYVKPGDRVGILGDFAGYHTLTLASLVGEAGEVASLQDTSDEITRLNLDANLCRNVALDAGAMSDNDWGTLNQIFVRVGSELQIDSARVSQMCRSASQASWHIHVVDGQRSSHETKSKTLDIFRCLIGHGMQIEQNGISVRLEDLGPSFDWDQSCSLKPIERDLAQRKVG